ncbi:MAG: restriction endonuclease subunit S [Sphingopyxis sp.]|nr:restriction endonuclease subunit S [Sphingopyxis sp.]
MSSSLKPYPEYRDSGVDWLGPVPARWDVVRSKRVFREIDERSGDGSEQHLAMSQKLGLIPSANLTTKHTRSASYTGAKRCMPGDIVLNRLKAHLGVFARSYHQGVVSPDYTVLRQITEIDPRYFEYVYRSTAFRGELRKSVKGIVEGFWRLYSADLGRLMIPAPPLKEQRRIADFLDTYIIHIRCLVDAKRRTITLLTERKQAILTELLRDGLDGGNTVSNDLAWIDRHPIGWRVNRLKPFVSNLTELGTAPPQSEAIITLDRVESWSGRLLDESPGKGEVFTGKRFEQDDILFGKLRPYLAKVMRASTVGLAGTEFLVLRGKAGTFQPRFLEQLLRSEPFINYVSSHSVGAKMPRTEWEKIASITVAIPSISEQDRFCDNFACATSGLDKAIQRERAQIELITEYHDSLIAAIVTGKLDVREAEIAAIESEDFMGESVDDPDDLEGALDAVD